jgi:hypothetical protein
MTKACPVNYRQVNEKVTRLNAFATMLFASAYLISGWVLPLVVLLADLVVRAFGFGKYSLITQLNQKVAALVNLKPVIIDAGPKEFASKIAIGIVSVVILTNILQWQGLSLVFAGILAFFSCLESFFGFCVACKIYPLFITQKQLSS